MSSTESHPVTQAVRFLRTHQIPFRPFLYDYEDRGGTRRSSSELGIDEHRVIKTLVFETDQKKPILVLMHGDLQVSTKNLARQLGLRSIEPCQPVVAEKWTGYQVGGTSPMGTKSVLPIYAERSIFSLPSILINGGKRGFLVEVDPLALSRALAMTHVDVGIPRG